MKDINSIKNAKAVEILNEAEERLALVFGTNLMNVILYGSYARGDNSLDSDIDIMALVDLPETELHNYHDRLVDVITELSIKHGLYVSIIDESYDRFTKNIDVLPFFMNVSREGVSRNV